MKYTLYTFFFSICLSASLYGQIGLPGVEAPVVPFERVYTAADEDHITLDLDTLPGGSFLTLAAERNSNDELRRMNVTSFDNKGNINWTMTYEYKRDQELLPIGDIEVVGDDSIVFTAILDTTSFQRIITKIGPDGQHGWSKLTSAEGLEEEKFSGRSELISVSNNTFLEVSEISNASNRDLLVRYFGIDGTLDLNRSLSTSLNTSSDAQLVDVLITQDTTIAILSNNNSEIRVTTLDTLGNVLNIKSYESPLDDVVDVRATNFSQLANGDFAISGQVVETNGVSNNLILHTTSDGEVKTGHLISATEGPMSILDIDGRPDSTIVYMGFANVDGGQLPYMAQMKLDSSLGWNSYSFNSLAKDHNGFGATADGGVVMYLSGGTREVDDRETPYLVKYDDEGTRNNLCAPQSLTLSLTFTDIISSDEVGTFTDFSPTMDTISVKAEVYNGFSPPILTIPDTTYCPQDPINFVMDGTVEGAVTYNWMSMARFVGDDTDSIIVAREDGEFMLTVTGRNDENITCWTLCDTANVTKKEMPMVMIEPNFIQYCESGEALLGVSANNAIVEIEWSTGASQQTRIGIMEPGNYSVTIVDDCGNEGDASINIGQSDFDVMLPLEAQVEDTYCALGAVRISLVGFNANPAGLTWSNGESGVTSILVNESGDYSVMFEGFCEGVADINVSQAFFKEDGKISISNTCNNNMVTLQANVENADASFQWSTGNTGSSISVNVSGLYTVTGNDLCGDPITAEFEVTEDNLEECNVEPPVTGESCLEYPNAFVPDSREEINRSFAPKNDCSDLTEYRLRIYNRWGNKVFESDRVDFGWDGKKGDKDAPADVYFFYSTYVSGNATLEEKGDLLLIR